MSPKRTLVLARRATASERRIPRRAPDEVVPLSFGQEQIWLHSQLAPDAPLYTESLTIRRQGPLLPAVLIASFREACRRHEIWRTTFAWSDGRMVQQVRLDLEPTIEYDDLRDLPAGDRLPAALRLAAHDLDRPFDLGREPAFRARLVSLGDEEHRLFLCLHHIVFDGISIYRVFLPELAAIYEARLAGATTALEEPQIQYADFACWQRRSADEAAWERTTAYWRGKLDGAPVTIDLPTDRPRPSRQSFRGGLVRAEFDETLTAAARTTALAEGCTLFMLLFASFAATLHRWSGQTDMVVGSVSGGRDHPELERIAGYFLRMLVLRTDLHGDPTFRELLGRVREVLLEALCHDGLPYQRMVRALTPARDLSRSPLFQVTFSIEPPLPELRPAWDLTEMDAGPAACKFDLSMELEDRGDVIHIRAIHSTDLFDGGTIFRLVEDWRRLLSRAVDDPSLRLHELVRA